MKTNAKATKSVIINVHPQSSYARFNGQTFEVYQELNGTKPMVAVIINGSITDFTEAEVIRVN